MHHAFAGFFKMHPYRGSARAPRDPCRLGRRRTPAMVSGKIHEARASQPEGALEVASSVQMGFEGEHSLRLSITPLHRYTFFTHGHAATAWSTVCFSARNRPPRLPCSEVITHALQECSHGMPRAGDAHTATQGRAGWHTDTSDIDKQPKVHQLGTTCADECGCALGGIEHKVPHCLPLNWVAVPIK